MSEWVVTYRPRTSRARTAIWATIAGVPADVDSGGVLEALEAWQRWPAWQARIGPGASFNVRRKRAGDVAGGDVVIEWDELAPAEKRIGVVVSGPAYAAIVRAARADGRSLRAWCAAALAAAAGVTLATLEDGPPAVLFEDVPLPGVV